MKLPRAYVLYRERRTQERAKQVATEANPQRPSFTSLTTVSG